MILKGTEDKILKGFTGRLLFMKTRGMNTNLALNSESSTTSTAQILFFFYHFPTQCSRSLNPLSVMQCTATWEVNVYTSALKIR